MIMWKRFLCILLFLWCGFVLGCLQLGLRASPSLFHNFASSVFEECDTELARNSLPANLKLLEGLLKSDPHNPKILTTLAMGFAGYSLLFVEPSEPERASDLYLRARAYAIRALGPKGELLTQTEARGDHLKAALSTIGMENFEALFWATLSLTGWINLNLDKPAALGQLGRTEMCLKRLVEMQPDYLYGLPHILMGVSLSVRPPLLGGDVEGARFHFEEALKLSNRKFFLAQYYFARYYAVRIQDRALFTSLLGEIANGNSETLEDVCLINRIMQQRALELEKKADDLFI
jgi:tetratricopeptide (TPR) repeat protein